MPATVASLGSLPLPDLGSTFDPKTLPWLQAPLRLISLDLLPRIDRAVSILRHRELNGAIERGGRRIPNLLYLPDPFQTASLHLVYNHLNLERFTIENVRAAVQSGSLEGLLSAEDSKNLPASILSFLESLCLVILYIRAFALPTGEPPEFITKICDKAIPPTTSSHFHSSLWYEAFTEHNVRLTDYQQVGSPQRMAPSNVYMNEVCERIRLVKVREDLGIKEGAEAQRISDSERGKRLGRSLLCSLLTFLDFADDSASITTTNLHLLSTYHTHLPLSWFTLDFLNITVRLAERAIVTGRPDNLASITALWSAWTRRLQVAKEKVDPERLGRVMELMGKCLEEGGPARRDEKVKRNCWIGLGACAGQSLGAHDLTISTTLENSLLNHPPDTPTLQATISHFLRATRSRPALVALWSAYVRHWARGPAPVLTADDAVIVVRMGESVVASRARDAKKRAKEKGAAKDVRENEGLNPAEAAEAMRVALLDWQDDGTRRGRVVGLLAAGGILRALQTVTPAGQAGRWKEERVTMEEVFAEWLNAVAGSGEKVENEESGGVEGDVIDEGWEMETVIVWRDCRS
ncbi:hypothetical protein BC938DRAFT_483381 [Jimgerdemannia flammicorona]|uniref:Uncharacterized protein n=1 Tax=Jimgerdemannia flammicorona TaxID=994334 RepID=A0A433QC45_9FUNG|nr:hypothetical protein BC938DRAFT_483381 [Jimgerdemannia flammicorona]